MLIVAVYHAHEPWLKAGFIGVGMFFVLSGYLITSLLLNEYEKNGRVSLPRFYMRRALRLMPALWVLVLVTLAATWLWKADEFPELWRNAVWSVLYVTNWARVLGADTGILTHTWSLAVEEQFYLLWPALLWFFAVRGGGRRVFQAALALALCSWLWRIVLLERGAGWLRVACGLDTCFIDPMLGCTLAAWLHGREKFCGHAARALSFLSAAALPALLLIAALQNGPTEKFYYVGSTAVAVLSALIICDVVHNPESKLKTLLCWSPLVRLGVISYGMYLWHLVAGYTFMRWAQPSAPVALVGVITLGITFAVISFHIVERPFLRLKKRFEVR